MRLIDHRVIAFYFGSGGYIYDTATSSDFNEHHPETIAVIEHFPRSATLLGDVRIKLLVMTYDCEQSPPFTCIPLELQRELDYVSVTDGDSIPITWTTTAVPLPAGLVLLPGALALLVARRRRAAQ